MAIGIEENGTHCTIAFYGKFVIRMTIFNVNLYYHYVVIKSCDYSQIQIILTLNIKSSCPLKNYLYRDESMVLQFENTFCFEKLQSTLTTRQVFSNTCVETNARVNLCIVLLNTSIRKIKKSSCPLKVTYE